MLDMNAIESRITMIYFIDGIKEALAELSYLMDNHPEHEEELDDLWASLEELDYV